MNHKNNTTFYLILLIVLFVNCGRETPINPNEQLPPLKIESSITSGENISSDSITFILKSNTDRTEYRFRLNNSEWSLFSPSSSVFFNYLDDGNYTFDVEARNTGWETTSSKQFTFTVATHTSSSIFVYPQKAYYQTGSPVQCQLKTANIKAFDKIHIEIQGLSIQDIAIPATIDSQKITILQSSSVIDLFLHPDYQGEFKDSLTLLNLLVSPLSVVDTVRATITALARNSSNEPVEISKARGCILIKK